MFDPTAFENMKVIVEGAFYDLDLSDEIIIVDRNDILNTAKLSRKYEITFSNYEIDPDLLNCTFIIEAGLENLAAELLQAVQSERLSGCHVFIKFSLRHPNNQKIINEMETGLKKIWGQDRIIQHSIISNPFIAEKLIKHEILISFNRLVYEDQMDDLIAMIDYMVNSLNEMKTFI